MTAGVYLNVTNVTNVTSVTKDDFKNSSWDHLPSESMKTSSHDEEPLVQAELQSI